MLGVLNRLAGGVIGLSGALIIVWTAFVVITLLYVTSFGKELYTMIETDNFLSVLYQYNFLSVLYQYNPIMSLATMFR